MTNFTAALTALGRDARVPADETSALLAPRSASVSLAAIEASRLDGGIQPESYLQRDRRVSVDESMREPAVFE
ncbi:MAG TPA: hypothetical protein VHX14_19450 [Thermoanaerobaculia bacterium]|nr:hypothetical protein [Thermoanaerobaculia bacterium]